MKKVILIFALILSACQTVKIKTDTGLTEKVTSTAPVSITSTVKPLAVAQEATKQPHSAIVCVNTTVYMRSGAGTQFDDVSVLVNGQPLVLTGAIRPSADGGKWYPVTASTVDGLVAGFVNSQFVCEVK